MEDYIIKTGDLLKVNLAPPATVPALQAPVPLIGSSRDVLVGGVPVCLRGDELPLTLRLPLPYTAAPYTNPGTGTLSLSLLPANTTQLTENGKPLLIKGKKFIATFTVGTPATQSTPDGPVPDPVQTKQGTAEFITTNDTVKAG
ncbi:MAG TPA: hypothetical protein VJ914_03550 [Pseudonocardiaceae bacterium]|nr:hypothetical protein [Pseudonocardiaceae bacterium]